MATLHRASSLVPFFQQHLPACVSGSHFGNSCNISKFIIITLFSMVIWDRWLGFAESSDEG